MFLHVYKTKGKWRWCVFDRNEQVIAVGARTYSRSSDAKRAFFKLYRLMSVK